MPCVLGAVRNTGILYALRKRVSGNKRLISLLTRPYLPVEETAGWIGGTPSRKAEHCLNLFEQSLPRSLVAGDWRFHHPGEGRLGETGTPASTRTGEGIVKIVVTELERISDSLEEE